LPVTSHVQLHFFSSLSLFLSFFLARVLFLNFPFYYVILSEWVLCCQLISLNIFIHVRGFLFWVCVVYFFWGEGSMEGFWWDQDQIERCGTDQMTFDYFWVLLIIFYYFFWRFWLNYRGICYRFSNISKFCNFFQFFLNFSFSKKFHNTQKMEKHWKIVRFLNFPYIMSPSSLPSAFFHLLLLSQVSETCKKIEANEWVKTFLMLFKQ